MKILPILFICLVSVASPSAAQELQLRPSPLAITSMRFQDHYVKITYSQPQKKKRAVFGQLVPYGKVWRTGANEATEITTVKDIMLDNQVLKAGTYSIFTIPGEKQWTIIINSDVGQWGAYNYNEKKDVFRFDVPAETTSKIYEPFTILFDQKNEVADLLIMWDNIKVKIPVKFLN